MTAFVTGAAGFIGLAVTEACWRAASASSASIFFQFLNMRSGRLAGFGVSSSSSGETSAMPKA
jgi:hypothetical protein